MKKIYIILIAICFISSAGCGNAKNYISEEIPEQTLVDENSTEEVDDFQYDFTQNPYYLKDNHDVVVADGGYYFVRNTTLSGGCDNMVKDRYSVISSDISAIMNAGDTAFGKMIYYYDINKRKVTPLCSNINCKHNSADCEAYFKNIEDGEESGYVYYNDRIYMTVYDSNSGIKLISYDKWGKDQKTQCDICKDPNYLPCVGSNNDVCILNGMVYSWGIKNELDGGTVGYEIVLFRTEINNNKTEIIKKINMTEKQYKYTKNYSNDIQISNNKLYVKVCHYDEEADAYTYNLYELDDKTGTLIDVLTINTPRDCNKRANQEQYAGMRGYAVDKDGNIFYVDEMTDAGLDMSVRLRKYNINTKITEDIYTLDHLVGYKVMCDDDYVYLQADERATYKGKIIIMDKDGNEKYIKSYNKYVFLEGIDDRYLIVKINVDPFKNSMDDSTFIELNDNEKPETYVYAILRKSTIGTGNEEWKKMYNGMYVQ